MLGVSSEMTESCAIFASRIANKNTSGWLTDHVLLITDGCIEAIVPKAQAPTDLSSSRQVYDVGDKSVLPGHIEAHAHMHCSATHNAYQMMMTDDTPRLFMRATGALRQALLAGVTTMRDLGSRNEIAFAMKSAIADGVIVGPDMLVAGTPITTTAGHCWFFGSEADNEDELVKAVRRQIRLGADVIKVMATGGNFTPTSNTRRPQYDAKALRAAVDEAERSGIPVAAHVHAASGVRNCVDAGVHHLIHCRWLSSDPKKGFEYDPETATRIADKGLFVDSTIGTYMLREEAAALGLPVGQQHWSATERPITPQEQIDALCDMRARGVGFTAGLDMGMSYAEFNKPGATAWAYVDWLGFTPWQALSSATRETANALGLAGKTGSLIPGLNADIAVFRGDPAKSIRDWHDPETVFLRGRPVKLSGRELI